MKRRLVSAISLSCLWIAPAMAGVVFEVETKDSAGKTQVMEMRIDGKNMSVPVRASKQSGDASQPDGKMLFKGEGDGQMIVIDDDQKSYMVLDTEQMRAMSAQLKQVQDSMPSMDEMLKNVPEAQREQVRKMMEQRMPAAAKPKPANVGPTTKLVKTGKTATKSGYACSLYEVHRDGQKSKEYWVTDWDNVEGGGDVRTVFEELAEFMTSIKAAFAGAPGGMFGDNPFEHMKEMNGFPVVTRSFEGGEFDDESTLLSAKRRDIDPAEFEPPSGYKRSSMGP